ncbi:MAG: molybdopterin molybdotransferase MoeA [Rubrivivax sp.]|nr:molybdopterin molybdotransferase MoeA [Rubrivivax sp.]
MNDTPPGPSPLAAGERSLSVAQARAAMRAALQPLPLAAETLPLAQAAGRVLAADLVSPIDVPAHDNSAMDGWAFDGAALRAGESLMLRVVGQALAGAAFGGRLGAGEAVRIMTGAVMPAGADTVLPLELGAAGDAGEVVVPPGAVRRGEHRRRRGEDLAQGQPALGAGRVLRPADLGLAASLGRTTLPLRRRLRVGLFSTGDEIVEPGQPLPAGGVYDSNRTTLAATMQRLGLEVLDLGLARDDPQALDALLARALREADAVVTSGGVSMGDADHTRDVLARHGEIAFWKVAMRPGRPFAFGPLRRPDGGRSWLFALPGNPVAALVTFLALVREPLLVLAGAQASPLPLLTVPAAEAIRKRPGRTEFQRGLLERDAAGGWCVRPFAQQGAGILRSMSQADALIVLEHERGSVAAGEPVAVWLFDGLV